MGYLFRHMAVRLWATVIGGGAVSLLLVPYGDILFGITHSFIPAVLIFVTVFFLLGAVFNRLVKSLIEKALNEAAVWERARHYSDADVAYERAVSLLDSYLISPSFRRRYRSHVLSLAIRYYLSSPSQDPRAESMILHYIESDPSDEGIVERWLETVLERRTIPENYHPTVDRVASLHMRNRGIPFMLALFYIRTRRSDFTATQVFHSVLSQKGTSDYERFLPSLAALLLSEDRYDSFSFEIFIDSYERNRENRVLHRAIFICLHELKHRRERHALIPKAVSLLKRENKEHPSDRKDSLGDALSEEIPMDSDDMDATVHFYSGKEDLVEKKASPVVFCKASRLAPEGGGVPLVVDALKEMGCGIKREEPVVRGNGKRRGLRITWLFIIGLLVFLTFIYYNLPLITHPWPGDSPKRSFLTFPLERD